MSSCHHFNPCLAEYSNAWWLLCQPSPNASNATHLYYTKLSPQKWTKRKEATRQINFKTFILTSCSLISHQYSTPAFPIHGMLNLLAKLCGIPTQFSPPAHAVSLAVEFSESHCTKCIELRILPMLLSDNHPNTSFKFDF